MFNNFNLNLKVKNKNGNDRKTIIVSYHKHDYMPSNEEYFEDIFYKMDGIVFSWNMLEACYTNTSIHVFIIEKSYQDKLLNIIKEILLGMYEDSEDGQEIIRIGEYSVEDIDFILQELDGELCEIERDDMVFYIPNINNNLDYDEDVEELMDEILEGYAILKCNYTDGFGDIAYFLEECEYNEYIALREEIYSIENEVEEIDKAMDKDKENRKEELLDRFMEIYEMICES